MNYKKITKNVIVIICIICLFLLENSAIFTSNADELEKILLNENANEIIKGINYSLDIIKQQNDNEHENKQYNEEYLKWISLSNEEKEKYGDAIPNEEFISLNLENDNIDNKGKLLIKKNNINSKLSNVLAEENGIPSKFFIENIKTESQGDSGWCWAYSSLKCLETYLKKNKNLDYNLAEYHMAYMRFKEFGGWNDSLEKNVEYSDYGNEAYKKGGNFDDFMKYVGVYSKDFNIKGPILGADSENKEYNFSEDNKLNFSKKIPKIKVNKTVQFANISKKYDSDGNAQYYNGNRVIPQNIITEFRKSVKEQIINNGGVFSIIDMNMLDFNQDKNSLYTNTSDIQNSHAVTIIGWDDNYLASNFKEGKQPSKNGAWIALNSWGEAFGENGIFYISYDDAIVEKFLCGIIDAEEYKNVPKVNISYDKSKTGQVKVIISSNGRLQKPDDSWELTYDEFYNTKYSIIRTTSTKLEKIYYTNVKNEVVTIKDNSNAEVNINVNIDSIANYKFGDINTDGNINITDLLLLKRHIIAGTKKDWILSDEKIKFADINNDEKVDIIDMLLLKRILLKKQ